MVQIEPHSQPAEGLAHPQTGQQQPRRNDHRRAHITHTRGITRAPSPENQGDYTTGSQEVPTTEGHTTKTGSPCSPIQYIDTNTMQGNKHHE